MNYHTPVLLKESIGGLSIKRDGLYVDLAYDGGGHSMEILNTLILPKCSVHKMCTGEITFTMNFCNIHKGFK